MNTQSLHIVTETVAFGCVFYYIQQTNNKIKILEEKIEKLNNIIQNQNNNQNYFIPTNTNQYENNQPTMEIQHQPKIISLESKSLNQSPFEKQSEYLKNIQKNKGLIDLKILEQNPSMLTPIKEDDFCQSAQKTKIL